MFFLENCLDIDSKKQCRIIFDDIALKFERGFIQCCGSIVFLSTPATAKIIYIQSNTENVFREKKSFTV